MSELSSLSEQVNYVLSRLSEDIRHNRLQLPSPPENLIALRKLIQQDASTEQIVSLLNKEPHVSARLIKLANSALFNSRLQVSSVKLAVTRLGMQKVSNLVTGFAITQQILALKIRGIEKSLKKIWLTSEQLAGITSTLARHFSTVDPDKALLAGQVHNIGEAPLLIHLNTLPELKQAEDDLRQKITQLILQRMSARVGSSILKKWAFPDDMVKLPHVAYEGTISASARVDISHLLQLGGALKSCDFSSRLEQLPPAFLSSPSFSLLWKDENEALTELNGIAGEVVETQRLLRSM